MQCPEVNVLVKFEGVCDVVYFEENEISCMKLYHITSINTSPSAKRAAIKLETRANTNESNLGMKATKF